MAHVQLEGPLYAWSDTALACRVGPGDEALPMMAFLGPEHPPGTDPPSREWIGRGGAGVLPLTDVMPYGNRHIWLYPRMENALGLARLVEFGVAKTLPTPIAARLVAEVAHGPIQDRRHRMSPSTTPGRSTSWGSARPGPPRRRCRIQRVAPRTRRSCGGSGCCSVS